MKPTHYLLHVKCGHKAFELVEEPKPGMEIQLENVIHQNPDPEYVTCQACGEKLTMPELGVNFIYPVEDWCDECGGVGEVTTQEPVYAGEPHTANIGTRKCHCKISEPDYDQE